MSLYDPATLEPLPVLSVKDGALIDPATRDVALIRVGAVPSVTVPFDQPWQFDRTFALSGARAPVTATAGSDLHLALQWDGLASTPVDYTTFVHIVGPDGSLAAQQDRPPLDGFAPTHVWAPGLRLVDDYTIPLPPEMEPGSYEIRVGLYDQATGRLPVAHGDAAQGDYAVIGTFDVR